VDDPAHEAAALVIGLLGLGGPARHLRVSEHGRRQRLGSIHLDDHADVERLEAAGCGDEFAAAVVDRVGDDWRGEAFDDSRLGPALTLLLTHRERNQPVERRGQRVWVRSTMSVSDAPDHTTRPLPPAFAR
jgi:hypothetical protein